MVKTDTDKQTFLDALARTGIVADACGAASVSRTAVTKWRNEDEQFAIAYLEALEDSADTLERAARQRAVEGVVQTRYTKDGQPYDVVTYSDSLMALLLKGNKPEKFAERTKAEISNPDGSLKPENATESAARIAAIFDEARRRRDAGEDPLFS